MQGLRKIINISIYFLIFFLPWQTRLIFKQGELNGGDFEYGTLSIYGTELLLALILVLGIAYSSLLLMKKRLRIKSGEQKGSSVPLFCLIVFLVLILTSVYFAIDQEIAFYKFSQIILSVALIFLILLTKPSQFVSAYSFVFAGFIQSIMAIYQFVVQKVYASSFLGIAFQDPAISGVPIIESNGERVLRSFGSLPHPNILAGFLVICLILVIALSFEEKLLKHKLFLAGSFITMTLALFMTASRSALLALLLGLIVFYLFNRKKDKKTLKVLNNYLIIFILIMILFSVVKPEMISKRFTAVNRLDIQSNTERIAGYSDAIDVFQNNWLMGTGPGNYTLGLHEIYPDKPHYFYQPLHNAILLPFVEMGLSYFLIFIGLIGLLVYSVKKKILNFKDNQHWTVALVMILAISMFDHYFYSFYFGIILTAIIVGFFLLQATKKEGR